MFTTLLCTHHVDDRKLIIAVQSAPNRTLRVSKVNFTVPHFTAIFRACFSSTFARSQLQDFGSWRYRSPRSLPSCLKRKRREGGRSALIGVGVTGRDWLFVPVGSSSVTPALPARGPKRTRSAFSRRRSQSGSSRSGMFRGEGFCRSRIRSMIDVGSGVNMPIPENFHV